MKSIVIYDSNYGNTKNIAETIAAEIGAKAFNISEIKPENLKEFELLVVGTPIIGWKPTEKMQAFLASLPKLDGVRATTFDTRVKLFIHGDAMVKVANSLKSLGAKIIIDPMPFYVAGPQAEPYLLEGEVVKARNWAKEINKNIK